MLPSFSSPPCIIIRFTCVTPHTSWHREHVGQDHAGFVIIGIGNVPWVLGHASGALHEIRHIDHEGHCYRKGKSSWYSRLHELWGCGVYISNSVGKEKTYGMTFSAGNRTCTLCELNGRMNRLHESELGPNFNVQNIPGIETALR